MTSVLKLTTAAAALGGAALFCVPAGAAVVGVGIGPVGFSINSGGYCDRWGCPRDYWTFPIYYGPIFYNNVWYRGPVYYRAASGQRWYWLHGAWRRDQWRGPRPGWARYYHFGPALGLDYYRTHGFRVREGDWRAWQDRNYRYPAGYGTYDRGAAAYSDEERNPDEARNPDSYRDYDLDRGMYGHDYDNDTDEDYDSDQYGGGDENRPDSDQDSDYDQDQYYGRINQGPDYDRGRGYPGYGYSRSNRNSTDDRDRYGYERSDYNRDRGTYEHSPYNGSGGASGAGRTTRHRHATHGTHHQTTSPPSNQDRGYQHTQYQLDRNQDQVNPDRRSRTRADDQARDHGNSGPPPDQDHSENQDGYRNTTYERPGSYGHAKGLPPSGAHRVTGSRPTQNPDENSGPSH